MLDAFKDQLDPSINKTVVAPFFVVKMLELLPDMLCLGNEDYTILTSIFFAIRPATAYHLVKFPAGFYPVYVSKTFILPVFRTGCYLPAWSVIKKLLYSLDANFLSMDQLP